MVLIAISVYLGYRLGKIQHLKTLPTFTNSCLREGQDSLINPLLECETLNKATNIEIKTFDQHIEQLVNQSKNEGKANKIAVYFRDLNNGPWFGINQDENFFPASLIKVPVMIAYFKKAEQEPQILEQELRFDENIPDANNLQHFKPAQTIEVGKVYKISELIEKMVIYSDNNAYQLLLNHIGPESIMQVFRDLGLPPPKYQDTEDVNSVHDYATFWRVLFNASYLNREDSKKALEILTKTIFSQGIVAGIPSNVQVAHKFGNYIRGVEIQMHDCGIVYYPQKPYIACIMTRGTDVDKQIGVMQDISRKIYQEVNDQTTSN